MSSTARLWEMLVFPQDLLMSNTAKVNQIENRWVADVEERFHLISDSVIVRWNNTFSTVFLSPLETNNDMNWHRFVKEDLLMTGMNLFDDHWSETRTAFVRRRIQTSEHQIDDREDLLTASVSLFFMAQTHSHPQDSTHVIRERLEEMKISGCELKPLMNEISN